MKRGQFHAQPQIKVGDSSIYDQPEDITLVQQVKSVRMGISVHTDTLAPVGQSANSIKQETASLSGVSADPILDMKVNTNLHAYLRGHAQPNQQSHKCSQERPFNL